MARILYHNGAIITGHREQDLSKPCTCLVVDDDIVAFVGDTQDPLVQDLFKDDEIDKVDLEGRTVLPGFIDGYTSPPLPSPSAPSNTAATEDN